MFGNIIFYGKLILAIAYEDSYNAGSAGVQGIVWSPCASELEKIGETGGLRK